MCPLCLVNLYAVLYDIAFSFGDASFGALIWGEENGNHTVRRPIVISHHMISTRN